jgi:hypothetical protein
MKDEGIPYLHKVGDGANRKIPYSIGMFLEMPDLLSWCG